ncbi:MAG TPA: ATP-binding protein [Kofleriaceae bacterium]|nr:ATP-binding protein [Kofleriaceae bacterium]
MKKKPEEVFTPRAFDVNPAMYMARPDLEAALANALRGDKQVIVHGESGSGKSWLYKKVLSDQDHECLVVDFANASRFQSVTKEFENVVARNERALHTGYTEAKEASIGAFGTGGKLNHADTYKLESKEPFERCLEFIRQRAGKKRGATIVLDNFERIMNSQPLIKELADLLALSDNRDYAQYRVKLLVVGVPSDLRSYFSRVDQQNTIANRLTEVPEVSRLEREQVAEFVTRGFVDELGVAVDGPDLYGIIEHIAWVTDGIPQQLHEYCYELALIAERNAGTLIEDDCEEADVCWLKTALTSSYTAVEASMNSRSTVAGRRNQTIFAIGLCQRSEFKYDDIEEIVRSEFPESTSDKLLNVVQILSALAESDPPLIVRTPKGDAYRLVNPKYRMSIRTMLSKDASGNRVEKRELGTVTQDMLRDDPAVD